MRKNAIKATLSKQEREQLGSVETYVAQNSRTTTLVRPSGTGAPMVMAGSPLMTKKSLMNGTTVPTDILFSVI